MKLIGRGIDFVNNWLGNITCYAVLVVTLFMILEVVMRYFFRRPTLWVWDMNMQMFAIMVFLGAGYHIYKRQIISVDVFYDKFPPFLKLASDVIAFLCMLIFLGALLWTSSDYAMRSFLIREHATTAFGPPIYHLKMMMPLAALLMILQFTKQYFEEFANYFKNKGANNSVD